jgi:hypothetical protein
VVFTGLTLGLLYGLRAVKLIWKASSVLLEMVNRMVSLMVNYLFFERQNQLEIS